MSSIGKTRELYPTLWKHLRGSLEPRLPIAGRWISNSPVNRSLRTDRVCHLFLVASLPSYPNPILMPFCCLAITPSACRTAEDITPALFTQHNASCRSRRNNEPYHRNPKAPNHRSLKTELHTPSHLWSDQSMSEMEWCERCVHCLVHTISEIREPILVSQAIWCIRSCLVTRHSVYRPIIFLKNGCISHTITSLAISIHPWLHSPTRISSSYFTT